MCFIEIQTESHYVIGKIINFLNCGDSFDKKRFNKKKINVFFPKFSILEII